MQTKKYSLLVLFGLFLVQSIVPMDAPTKDDGQFGNQGQNQNSSQITTSRSQIEKGKEKVSEGGLEQSSSATPQEIRLIHVNEGQRKILTTIAEIQAKMKGERRFTTQFIDLLLSCAPEDVQEFVNQIIENPESLSLEIKEILFSGPTGVGKSDLAKAIAKKIQYYYFRWSCNTGDTYQNSASINIERQLEAIDKLNIPCVIIFDEIDFLTSRYNNKQDSQRSSVGTFWDALDRYRENKNFIFIMTTNNLYDIPDQIERRCVVYDIPKPNAQKCKAIIKFYLNKHNKEYAFDLEKITGQFEGLCTASIIRILNKAITLANLDKASIISKEHMIQAFRKAKILENAPWKRRIYKKIKPQSDGFHWLTIAIPAIGLPVTIIGAIYTIKSFYLTAESNVIAEASKKIAEESLKVAKKSLEVAENSNWWQKAATIGNWGIAVIGVAGTIIVIAVKKTASGGN